MACTLTPQTLRCEYLHDPLALGTERPRLSWTLAAEGRSRLQTAFRILVATSPEALHTGEADLWDSGQVVSDRTAQVAYDGRLLAVRERAWWCVQVWDHAGAVSAFSEAAWWEQGLGQGDWQAAWIGLDTWNPRRAVEPSAPDAAASALPGLIPSPYLRTTLHLDGTVRRARLFATAKGVYELRLNGARVSDALLAPGWTDYDRRIQYQAYDVTAMLRQGDNALGAILAPGWYSGYIGFDERCRHYGTRPQLLLQGWIEYEGGRLQTLASDDSWRASTGPILYSDFLAGECYDARREPAGWDQPGFDDKAWRQVEAIPRTALPLVADPAEPVRVVAEVEPVTITEQSPGTYIVDLGQNIAGWVRLLVNGPAGTAVQLRFAEILQPDGTLYVENLRAARCTDVYVTAGHGDEIYEPRFTFHGFRYVEVSGYPGTLTSDRISGRVVASDTARSASFTCSSELVNRLQHNIEWGQRDNFLSIPTDCPQRDERLGWLGDAQVFVGTACWNADVAAFFTKWMVDVEDGQSAAGAFPDVAPRLVALSDGAPAWGDAGVIVPWTIYRRYGDSGIVLRHYRAMNRWMDYLLQANPGYLREGRMGANYGDWLANDADTPREVLATAYWAYDAHLMAEMARAIGEAEEAEAYAALFQRIKEAFIAAYVDEEGHVAGRTQTSYVVALHMDLLAAPLRKAAAAHLVADIEARGGHLSTGFVGVGYISAVLAEAGYLSHAYQLLLNETFPSWGYTIRQGATTIWERWDGWTEEKGFQDPGMNSFNHYSLGSVGDWLFRGVIGLDTDPEAPGFARMTIRPRPGGGLTHAHAEYHSIRGAIAVSWQRTADSFSLDVTIPANTTAVVHLPVSSPRTVLESGVPLAASDGVHALGTEVGEAVVLIGSGAYHFTMEAPAM